MFIGAYAPAGSAEEAFGGAMTGALGVLTCSPLKGLQRKGSQPARNRGERITAMRSTSVLHMNRTDLELQCDLLDLMS